MGFLNNLFVDSRKTITVLLLVALVNLALFGVIFGFHVNNDTDSYITAINFFRNAPGGEMYPNRYLNPLYSVVGATVFSFLTPADSIIALNSIFYFGIVLLTYGLVRRVFGSQRVGFITATLFITGYPLLRYGLTQVEDIGGYFWFVLGLYAGWRWWEEKKYYWLLLGSVAISGGLLTKESGAMAALFIGALILLANTPWVQKIKDLLLVSSLAFLTLCINIVRGREIGYNSLQWLLDNWKVYAPANYVFIKWVGVSISTYNLLWVIICFGAYLFFRQKYLKTTNSTLYFLAVLVPSLSYFAWPLFISRTMFISAWLFMPFGALAIDYLFTRQRYVALVVWLLVLVAPFVLQNTLRYAHVFQIWDQCHHQIGCSWEYFWNNRSGFSTEL